MPTSTPELDRHPFFTRWQDPAAGVVSYVLTHHVAPIQQSFYYTSPSLAADSRWLWFYTAFEPNPHRTLGVVSLDPDEPLVRHFPQASFSSCSPCVTPEGDSVWLCIDESVWKLHISGSMTRIASLPADYIAGRHLWRLATHLTRSPDGRYLLLDGEIGNHSFLALASLQTGNVEVVREFQARHNHAQWSPHRPDCILLAQDQQQDPITGRFIHHDLRIHLIRPDGTHYRCLTPDMPCRPYHGPCHEWWLADGRVGFVDYDTGVWAVDLNARREHIWKQPLCHAHSDCTGRWFCADQSPYFWNTIGCSVWRLDRATDQVTPIDTALPVPTVSRSRYHIDPHPQCSPDGRYIVYTTTRLGTVTVAISPLPAD